MKKNAKTSPKHNPTVTDTRIVKRKKAQRTRDCEYKNDQSNETGLV
jgi:hypothetical protein